MQFAKHLGTGIMWDPSPATCPPIARNIFLRGAAGKVREEERNFVRLRETATRELFSSHDTLQGLEKCNRWCQLLFMASIPQ